MAEEVKTKKETIVCFGNSITQGFGVQPDQSYPSLLQRLLGIRVINAGVDGDTAEGGLARVDKDVVVHKPELVLVEFGANDYLAGVAAEDTRRNLEQIIGRIQGAGAEVMVLSLGRSFWGDEYEDALAQAAKLGNCWFVSDLLAGIVDNTMMTLDEVHPNVPGYIVIARRVADFLVDAGVAKAPEK